MKKNKTDRKSDWQREFDKQFPNGVNKPHPLDYLMDDIACTTEVKDFISNLLSKQREKIINTIMETEHDDLGMGEMSKDEKMGVDAFKMYLKHKLNKLGD